MAKITAAGSTSTTEGQQPRSMFSSLSTTATSAKTSRADHVSAGSEESIAAAAEVASDIIESNTGMFLCKHVGCILHSTIHAVPEGRSHREKTLLS